MTTRSAGAGAPALRPQLLRAGPRWDRACGYCHGKGFLTKACPICGRYRVAEGTAGSDSLWTEAEKRSAWGER